MHVYQMRSSNQTIVVATQQRLTICMNALRDVSKVWLVAKMVHTLFESILGNKVLEERLQKAAGKRHGKQKHNSSNNSQPRHQQKMDSEASKRKFDDMEFGYGGVHPAPQMSYERSRPQSPVNAPTRHPSSSEPGQIPNMSASSPPLRQATDAFMGLSRSNTRPTTPFNTYSYPGTPPELFLHTRNSPNISQDLWQNYQPDQLFPPDTNIIFPLSSPNQPQHAMVDPALRPPPPLTQQHQYAAPPANMQQQQHHHQQHQHQQQHQQQQQVPHHHPQQPHPGMHASPQNNGMQQQQQPHMVPQAAYEDAQTWAHMQEIEAQRRAQEQDTWSQHSGSTGPGPIVPTTLNVGDWFEFFGIPNGDMAALHGGGQY